MNNTGIRVLGFFNYFFLQNSYTNSIRVLLSPSSRDPFFLIEIDLLFIPRSYMYKCTNVTFEMK